MTKAVLSLGSNMGRSQDLLEAAVVALGSACQSVSSVYRTPPWGPVEQDDFLNVVAIVSDEAIDAAGWWERAQQLERAAHRERLIRWGPRTLDVDVIAVWRRSAGSEGADGADGAAEEPVISDDPSLTLPHPRAFERGFVLVPWAELEPDAILPTHGRIADLLAGLDISGIERVGSLGAP